MTAITDKAPTLAWLLTALACFLAGMALTEGRYQAAARPALEPVVIVVTADVAFQPTATPELTPLPTLFPTPAWPTTTPYWQIPDMTEADSTPRAGGAGNVR